MKIFILISFLFISILAKCEVVDSTLIPYQNAIENLKAKGYKCDNSVTDYQKFYCDYPEWFGVRCMQLGEENQLLSDGKLLYFLRIVVDTYKIVNR